ncbi:hypothetical protein Ddye_012337 [Dipteronia dyeriana]|uniref:Reverse transcriptase n=1 Tax=Dipteronia dyeriana TaxID=168575 RepID=A0AAE0CIG9_9ROSI|nr:hypothetical protein Ddye_012337 [Dipteronia dyeriana]
MAMNRIFECVQPCLTLEKSRFLDSKFTADEIKRAVFDMHPTKAPGLDGLPALFYQKYWSMWEVVAKAFASRSRVVLNEVISETQSVFIPGRLISDNAIVRFECMHALKRRKKGRKGVMTIKLDMSKAYDRIEWSFISGMLCRLGF